MSAETNENRRFPCAGCGAWSRFDPGEQRLDCPYCGHATAITAPADPVHEQDFESWLAAGGEERVRTAETRGMTCLECGAETTAAEEVTATECAFCGHALVATASARRRIPPTGLLPFVVTGRQARAALRRWLRTRWFAPSALAKKARKDDPLQGIYAPYWTFDAGTVTRYRGQRGDDYWVSQTYTATVNGKPRTRTRQVRRTRWSPASGRVTNAFDDVLVLATDTLPRRFTKHLEPWDLPLVVSVDPRYLAGFRAETYRIGLGEGFGHAKEAMRPEIERTIRRDIGGDHQRIADMNTTYHGVAFKHLLLPIWLSSYRYRGRTFRFLVNGRTGEVQGERPYSPWKIGLAILGGVVLIGGGVLLFLHLRG